MQFAVTEHDRGVAFEQNSNTQNGAETTQWDVSIKKETV